LFVKKKGQSKGRRGASQPERGSIEFKVAGKAIAVEFADEKLSAHAGAATFWAWVHRVGFILRPPAGWPHAPLRSGNASDGSNAVGFFRICARTGPGTCGCAR